MPMRRLRAQSSFTVEFKHATRRTSEVLTLEKTSSLRRSALADQVFRTATGRSFSPGIGRKDDPGPVQQTLSPDVTSPGAGSPVQQARPLPRRVLPDLLSIPEDPVAERIKQEEEERATRRGKAQKERRRHTSRLPRPESRDKTLQRALPTVPDAARAAVIAPNAVVEPVAQARAPRSRKWNVLVTKARRAAREGLPMPRLPAGHRWRRRLPKVCW
jgi:hypothetical protein